MMDDGPVWAECPLDGDAPPLGWAPVWQYLQETPYHRLEEDRRRIARTVAENEVTYTTVDAGRAAQQAWRLDNVPYVLDGAAFEILAAGIVQRARLLEAVLADCHGPRRCLREGLVPPALFFGHPHFLRPCSGWRPRDGWLHLYGCDLIRDGNGRFRVLADQCQAPIGLGYAVENRLVIGTAHEARFRASGARRLAPFLNELRATLEALAPSGADDPRVVMLCPGESAESAGEHAFLARYLGIDLVEGGDLTARGDHLYLKTLGGLSQVDVVLRRVGDVWSDPLELRGDSLLGVSGLLGAARAGNLALANGIGSALVESPALSACLPALCRALLGEEPLLEQAETWWLGDLRAPGVEQLLGEDWVLRPVARDGLGETVFTVQLDAAGRDAWRERLGWEAWSWTASRHIAPSVAPTWQEGRLAQAPVSLRCFALRRGEEWQVMPGALARVAGSPSGRRFSFRHGAGSKDSWVLGGEPASPLPMPDADPDHLLRRGGVDVPSRLLDDLFWLGRCLEHSEWLLRLARALLACEGGDGPGEGRLQDPLALLRILAWAQDLDADERPALEQLADWHRGTHPSGLAAQLATAHGNGQRVRAHLAPEVLRRLGRLQRSARALAARPLDGDLLDELLDLCLACTGTVAENMVRGYAWSFLDLGRRIERAQCLLRSVTPLLAGAGHLDLVLFLADCRMSYRARYRSRMHVAAVYDLALVDTTNPRGLAFQLEAIERALAVLPPGEGGVDQAQQQARRLVGGVRGLDPREALTRPAALVTHLTAISRELDEVAQSIDLQYFSHAIAASRLGPSALTLSEGGVQQ